ncbi:MAG: peptide-methionine (S)-S-oxide reductase MsrA [Methanoregula sp.]|jgi:methionine-S-sulfoxide reductase|nr:peptide-methionine (S)-S-oxide reductase MsrA [Methanoregula sp.]
MEQPGQPGKATFAAGCFWDVEAAFRKVEGVLETVAGYTGGSGANPSYEQVESGTTGHAEAVGIVYDPTVVSYNQLLDLFWEMHDPTHADWQGEYTGSQYRSIIFYHNEKQKTDAVKSRDRIAASEKYRNRPLLTEILPASEFWPAEECHQRFYEKCGQGYCTSHKIWE